MLRATYPRQARPTVALGLGLLLAMAASVASAVDAVRYIAPGQTPVVLDAAADALGRALAPSVAAFRPDRVVVGGSIAGSWDLLAAPFHRAVLAAGAAAVDVVAAALGEHAGLVGAAALVAPQLGAGAS